MPSTVPIERERVIAAVKDLNSIVVSLDRLGYRLADGSRAELGEELVRFVDEWELFSKLASTRRLLYEALAARAESEAEEFALEAEIAATPSWP